MAFVYDHSGYDRRLSSEVHGFFMYFLSEMRSRGCINGAYGAGSGVWNSWSGLGYGWVGIVRMGGFDPEELWRWRCMCTIDKT